MPVEFQVYHLMLRPDDLERRKDIHEESRGCGVGVAGWRDGVALTCQPQQS